MNLEKLSSLNLADELSLDDFDLQKIIIGLISLTLYALWLLYTQNVKRDFSSLYSNCSIANQTENFRKKLSSKYWDVNDSMLNKNHTSVYTELTNYPSNYNQSYLIVQNSNFRNICANMGCTYKKKKINCQNLPGYFVFPKEKLSDNLFKKLEVTQITIDEDKREIATQIFNRLVSYELKEEWLDT
ncbi:hypothetical protein BpHYR1_039254 [Brachionus plicatilis]|uniref:Uncharacterized protein n=1 Tax=Brachionus plicatilis TaxID=10195 RepID=A0A3M7PQG3_BRAPC|nr:hypothetical protein BpHYR1_039254 [Brachionus plicatilis]